MKKQTNNTVMAVPLQRLVRFLWLVVRYPLAIVALTACLIFAPLPWITLTEPMPWWAYVLGYLGSLLAIPFGAMALLMVIAVPIMLAEKLMEAWRDSE